jgi:hypothetical protein
VAVWHGSQVGYCTSWLCSGVKNQDSELNGAASIVGACRKLKSSVAGSANNGMLWGTWLRELSGRCCGNSESFENDKSKEEQT